MATSPREIDGPMLNKLVTTIFESEKSKKERVCGFSIKETEALITQGGVINLIRGHMDRVTGEEYSADQPIGGNIIIARKDYDGTSVVKELILSFRYDLPNNEYYNLRIRHIPGKPYITSDVYVSTAARLAGPAYDGENKVVASITPVYIKQLFRICNKHRHSNHFQGY